MIPSFWMILAIMNGVHEDGSQDVMISMQYRFESSIRCKDFLKKNADAYRQSVINHYKHKKTIQRVLCVPEENVIKFLANKV